MKLSVDLVKQMGGFPARSVSEDTELTAMLMERRIFGHFVEDAVIYEDFPSTFKETSVLVVV